jgi:excinuclease ABC subunit B
LIGEINERVGRGERVLITTLTKRMAENLTDYFLKMEIKVRYLHSDVATLERTEIVRDLRLGVFDVLVGINLLREGLDLPEVSLVAILDADREGFLRHETSLIQTIGRAARNVNGKVIMYADRITNSMRSAIDETNRRRDIQKKYNEDHGIEPRSIQKGIRDALEVTTLVAEKSRGYDLLRGSAGADGIGNIGPEGIMRMIDKLMAEMKTAAKNLEFEKAASLRDQVAELRRVLVEDSGTG